MVYSFRKGAFVKGDAQKIGEELEEVRMRSGGFLDSHAIVDKARDEGSALHQNFTWDDSVAAEQYRLQQASMLACSIVVSYPETQGEKTRYYVSVKPSAQEEAKFCPVHIAVKDDFMRERLLGSALKEMKTFMKKYEELQELSRLFNAIQVTIEEQNKAI